ncbi:MAG: sigma-70 family RNA polymerase sigma factor [Planctomycetales bacterium]|nr:sigma-70 family RNA polymerase sigma factor [Planctomycetales bacterium]
MPVPLADGPSTSSTWLLAVRRFDQTAWQELAESYGPLIYSYARSRGLQDADAGDIVQEVFQRVANSISKFDRTQPGHRLRKWIITIAANLVRDFQRAERRLTQGVGGSTAQQIWSEVPSPAMSTSFEAGEGGSSASADGSSDASAVEHLPDVAARVLRLIRDEFQPKTWQIFETYFFGNLSAEEVACKFQVDRMTVHKYRRRVLSRFERVMADLGFDMETCGRLARERQGGDSGSDGSP